MKSVLIIRNDSEIAQKEKDCEVSRNVAAILSPTKIPNDSISRGKKRPLNRPFCNQKRKFSLFWLKADSLSLQNWCKFATKSLRKEGNRNNANGIKWWRFLTFRFLKFFQFRLLIYPNDGNQLSILINALWQSNWSSLKTLQSGWSHARSSGLQIERDLT